ncbi:6,7-dimethyl-8-ribityllumazine synthase [Cordyceps militaris CM01]|uniref:6,7-dimethyl-8-ribityllumazine synthase n=2 Tax=Cordyceps militaris TaxID=73501 RepID=G3JL20_CORMM|nr:6,7-dimethyl-8-ribityllumazine synthase [Cordyceps militaris CM01]ATY62723.1 6,7-dimethyl-8-ribityllumazine synthase [Cordyceps militaris]EGX90394.1 6,7-dimethyl-8-ribityllumazine synthase [Cordyceps militaris CM01]
MPSTSLKGPTPQQHDGAGLRIGIVHARWNATVIEPLIAGVRGKLLECGVKESNIVVQSCPGAWELPIAVQRLYAASQVQSTSAGGASAGDLLASSTADLSATATTSAFDAIIAVGVLIKGETMHFEYISESVSHGLMRVQLDTGVPVIFGVLTVLNDAQALNRAGADGKGHNHGEDWGLAAVEMGVKRSEWASGKIEG